MSKKRKILYTIIVTVLLLVIVLACVYSGVIVRSINSLVVQYKRSVIEKDVKNSGYCESSSDCKVIYGKCPYNCGVTVSKQEADRLESVISKMSTNCVADCAIGVHNVDCVDNHCRFTR